MTSAEASPYGDLDSVELLAAVRAGDRNAYGELYERHRSFAYAVARRISKANADDLVAESFRRILAAIDRGAGPTGGFGGYLATTIRSVALNQARGRRTDAVPVDVANFEQVPSDARQEIDPRVATAYMELPERWRDALWYADVEQLPARVAAKYLGMPSANAFSALTKRARASLRIGYLGLTIDEACDDSVRTTLRAQLERTTVDPLVARAADVHIASCSMCRSIADRVNTVTGPQVAVMVGPVFLAAAGLRESAFHPAGATLAHWLQFGWGTHTVTAVGAAKVAAVAALTVGVASEPAAPVTAAIPADPPPVVVIDEAATPAAPTGRPGGPSAPQAGAGSQGDGATSADSGNDAGAAPDTAPPAAPPAIEPPADTTTSTTTPSTTTPPSTTTTPPVAALPVGPTTTIAPTPNVSPTTTTPPTTTAPPTTTLPPTTTVPPTTTLPPVTTTTTTTPPDISPGTGLVVHVDHRYQNGDVTRRIIQFGISQPTGAPGTVTITPEFIVLNTSNLSCGTTSCVTVGAKHPDTIVAMIDTADVPVTITLTDGQGTPVHTLHL